MARDTLAAIRRNMSRRTCVLIIQRIIGAVDGPVLMAVHVTILGVPLYVVDLRLYNC
jgi:hypothetical protein